MFVGLTVRVRSRCRQVGGGRKRDWPTANGSAREVGGGGTAATWPREVRGRREERRVGVGASMSKIELDGERWESGRRVERGESLAGELESRAPSSA
jgi:hypothetical protein